MEAKSICAMLGVTQTELALALGVSRPLVSLFELGKRNLPLGAHKILEELLLHRQAKEQSRTEKPGLEKETAMRHRLRIADRLRHNSIKLRKLEANLRALQKKHDAAVNRARFLAFLKSGEVAKAGSNYLRLAHLDASATPLDPVIAIEDCKFECDCLLMENQRLSSMLEELPESLFKANP